MNRYKKWSQQYYKKNKDKIKKYQELHRPQYYQKNREKIIEYAKNYFKQHKDHLKQKHKEWLNKNKEKLRIYYNKKWHKKKEIEGNFTERQWKALKRKYKNRCAYCDKRAFLTIDHIIPISEGGTNWIWNIIPACQSCNSKKKTRIWRAGQLSLKL